MATRLYLVRTIDPNSGAENWIKVQAEDFDDARRVAERMGVQAREVMLDPDAAPGSASSASAARPAAAYEPEPYDDRPPPARDDAPKVIPTCLLISAIFNLIGAATAILLGFVVCFTFFLAIPSLVLAMFELKYRARLLQGPISPGDVNAVRIIAIIEICTFAYSNVPSAVCGIISLANLHELQPKASRAHMGPAY